MLLNPTYSLQLEFYNHTYFVRKISMVVKSELSPQGATNPMTQSLNNHNWQRVIA